MYNTDEVADEGAAEGDEKKKKRQTRGGKGMIKTKKETAEKERKVVMSRAPRGKKKYITVVTGLGTFGKYHSGGSRTCQGVGGPYHNLLF